MLPRWLDVAGLVAGLLYLLDQGEVRATAVPGSPVWEPAGFLGSSAWGLWAVAVGVTVLRRASRPLGSAPDAAPVSPPGRRTSSGAPA